MSRTCPYPKKKKRDEAHGQKEGTMSDLTTSWIEVEKIEDLLTQLQEVEAQIAVGDSSDVMCYIPCQELETTLGEGWAHPCTQKFLLTPLNIIA